VGYLRASIPTSLILFSTPPSRTVIVSPSVTRETLREPAYEELTNRMDNRAWIEMNLRIPK
jgi:hypothetical protein